MKYGIFAMYKTMNSRNASDDKRIFFKVVEKKLLRGFHSSKMELQRRYYSEKRVITITIKYLWF